MFFVDIIFLFLSLFSIITVSITCPFFLSLLLLRLLCFVCVRLCFHLFFFSLFFHGDRNLCSALSASKIFIHRVLIRFWIDREPSRITVKPEIGKRRLEMGTDGSKSERKFRPLEEQGLLKQDRCLFQIILHSISPATDNSHFLFSFLLFLLLLLKKKLIGTTYKSG